MAQYQSGRVVVASGQNTVDAAWQVLAEFAAQASTPGMCRFLTSGGYGDVHSHVPSTDDFVFSMRSGAPDPVALETIRAASITVEDSGAASAGSTTTLTDASKAWTVDEHVGRFVRIRGGDADEEWAYVTSNTATQVTFEPALAVAAASLDAYGLYDSIDGQLVSFRVGTPQDWVAAGVQVGQMFTVDGSNVFIGVQSVGARQLVLDANWGGADAVGAQHQVHQGFTPLRNYPFPEHGDAATPSIVRRALHEIDDDVAAALSLETVRLVGGASQPAFGAGWGAAAGLAAPGFYKASDGLVVLQGAAENAAASPPEVVFTLPVGYRPAAAITFVCAADPTGGSGLCTWRVAASGDVTLQSVDGDASVFVALDGIHFRAG